MVLPEILSRVAANEATITDYNDLRTVLTLRNKTSAVAKASYTLLSNPDLCRERLSPRLRLELAYELTKDLSNETTK